MLRCRVSVTFEFPLRPPLTARWIEVEAGSPHTILSRAVRIARKQLKPIAWSSFVACAERLGLPDEVADEVAEDDKEEDRE